MIKNIVLPKSINFPEIEIELNSLTVLIGEDSNFSDCINEKYFYLREFTRTPKPLYLGDSLDNKSPKYIIQFVEKLITTYSNEQFLIVTNSPVVISNLPNHLTNIYKFNTDDSDESGENRICEKLDSVYYGADFDWICRKVFNSDGRPNNIGEKIRELRNCIHNAEVEKAEVLLKELQVVIDESNPELGSLAILLRTKKRMIENN